VDVLSYCLMPNHFHLFLRTREANLAEGVGYFDTLSRYIHIRNQPALPGRHTHGGACTKIWHYSKWASRSFV
jgi:hypothetical protein